jgi:hypothetical protein
VVNQEWIAPDDTDAWAHVEDPEAYQVLTFDPGGDTGWSLFSIHPDAMTGDEDIAVLDNVEFWTAGEFSGSVHDQCDEIVELCQSWPGARLVTEGFKLRQMNAELSPVEINSVITWALRPRYFVVQMPSIMNSVEDDRLKRWGFWLPGKEHARDAVRHALYFLKQQKERAVRADRLVRASGSSR